MSSRELLTSLAVVVAILGLGALIELGLPLCTRTTERGRGLANLGLTALTLAINFGLTAAAALVALNRSPPGTGVMAWLGLPRIMELVASIIVLDFFFGYVAHRAMHLSPTLWRVHRVHHSDPFVDVTTTYRTHPLEVLWRFTFMMLPVWTLGIPAAAVVIYRLLSALNGTLEHANIRSWAPFDSNLSLIWVTPNMHKVHHSRSQPQTDSNYGNILSVYDRVLGTFTPTELASSVVYGLDEDLSRSASLRALLSLPFKTGPSDVRRRRVTKEVPA
jgi:sterol desaturase/sphingolipid hydroxylase (fatty acid hydroxylase superfamily)